MGVSPQMFPKEMFSTGLKPGQAPKNEVLEGIGGVWNLLVTAYSAHGRAHLTHTLILLLLGTVQAPN